MTDLPTDDKKNTKKSQKLIRDANGRFISSAKNKYQPDDVATDNNNLVFDDNNLTNTIASNKPVNESFGVSNKETLPNIDKIYLEEAEKTKELKEQLAELERSVEVKEIKGEVELPEIVKTQGVEQAGEDVSISSDPGVILPLDDEKIYRIVKNLKNFHQDITASITWLAVWCLRQLGLRHLTLKEKNGKIRREKES